MRYCVSQTNVSEKRKSELTAYFDKLSFLSERLYNAALFRLRQQFTMKGKSSLSANEREVHDEIEKTISVYGCGRPGCVLSYTFLEKLMRATGNPDFFSGLPMQSAQQTLKLACRAMKGWLEALRSYRADPSQFTGKPGMPGYRKNGHMLIMFTNQDCVIRDGMLKLPLTKERIRVHVPDGARLREVQCRPYYGNYRVICIFQAASEVVQSTGDRTAAIDFGVSNIASIVVNDENISPITYKGGALKSANRWYNMQRARYVSKIRKSHCPATGQADTAMLRRLGRYRSDFLSDQMHKISSDIVRHLIIAGVSTLVLGRNKGQKQNSAMGKKNNQSFVSLPLWTLQIQIRYKAENAGMVVMDQEESYTSKASFIDRDEIPVYGKERTVPSFSGMRKGRGLYVASDGSVLNADVNAAANILRKAFPEAVSHIRDHGFLQKIRVVRFYDLNQKRNPVKRIAAA